MFEKQILAKYLEYKGFIRIFVRVRPIQVNDFKAYSGTNESFAILESKINIPNSSQIEIEQGKTLQKHLFTFDEIFD
jgi:hypothetical protein